MYFLHLFSRREFSCINNMPTKRYENYFYFRQPQCLFFPTRWTRWISNIAEKVMLSNTQYGKSKLQKIKNSNTQFQPWLEQHKAFSRIYAEPINIYKNIIWFFTPKRRPLKPFGAGDGDSTGGEFTARSEI